MSKKMKYYEVIPEAAGEFGENTVEIGKKTDRPPKLARLHYEFTIWPEDDLQTTIGIYIGTDRLRKALEALSPPVTGLTYGKVELSGSEEFERVYRKERPNQDFGIWHWLKITGQPGIDDFGQNAHTRLVVSERIADVLKGFDPIYLEFEEFDPTRKLTETS